MDSKLLENKEPSTEKNEYTTFRELFSYVFPTYLALGMTYDQFFRDDPELVIFYREADKLKFKRENQIAWLNGRYVFDAVSVALANSFRKSGTKAEKYPNEPYDFEKAEREQKEKEIAQAQAQAWMVNFVNAFSKK